jgi:hypothetical protein
MKLNNNWKAIDGFADYYVSKNGKIYSTRYSPRYNKECKPMELATKVTNRGYEHTGIYYTKANNQTERKWLSVHRIVYEAFNGPIPQGLEINHKDGNRLNNRLSNLEAITKSENQYHACDVLKKRGQPIIYSGKYYHSISNCARKNNLKVHCLYESLRHGRKYKGIELSYTTKQH